MPRPWSWPAASIIHAQLVPDFHQLPTCPPPRLCLIAEAKTGLEPELELGLTLDLANKYPPRLP